MNFERQLPPGDRTEAPEPTGAGPRPGETFSQTLRRLAHERHGTPLDAEPANDIPASRQPGEEG